MDDEREDIQYNHLEGPEMPPVSITPTREGRSTEARLDRNRQPENIDFNGPKSRRRNEQRHSDGWRSTDEWGATDEWRGMMRPRTLDNRGDRMRSRPTPMKPGKFDGTGSLESFLAQFEVCCRHNRWSAVDKVDFLRCALEKAATQLLWDFGARQDVSYEELVGRLRERYGTEGQAETFRAQLYYRRQRAEETLSDLLHEIRRLVVLAYPVPSNETTAIIARDAFLEAMRDRELSLKVREREPKNLDEAYRTALRLEAYQRTAEMDDRRRPPNRVRATHEVDVNAEIHAQLDQFLTNQREEQRRWQRDFEGRIDRRLRELHDRVPMGDVPSSDVRTRNSNRTENEHREITCYNCGQGGHMARSCQRDRRGNRRNNGTTATRNATPPPEATVEVNHTLRQRETDRATNNAIYIRGTINGSPHLCLVDTGSEVSLVPFKIVRGVTLDPCNRSLMAANGSEIRVLGEVHLSLKVGRNFEIPSSLLVSDQITEPIMGMDWLREHRCRLGFGNGALFIGRQRIPLVKGNGTMWCRRVIVAEAVEISPKSQSDVAVRTLYGDLSSTAPAWMTETKEIQPGVHLARVVVRGGNDATQVRVINLNGEPVKLGKDQLLGGLHPVEVDVLESSGGHKETAGDGFSLTALLEDLPTEVTPKIRTQLERLLNDYRDVFSMSETDLGRTNVTKHRIDTGDAGPVRQPLRRQPLPHRMAVDQHLDNMLAAGTMEPTISEWSVNVELTKKTVLPEVGKQTQEVSQRIRKVIVVDRGELGKECTNSAKDALIGRLTVKHYSTLYLVRLVGVIALVFLLATGNFMRNATFPKYDQGAIWARGVLLDTLSAEYGVRSFSRISGAMLGRIACSRQRGGIGSAFHTLLTSCASRHGTAGFPPRILLFEHEGTDRPSEESTPSAEQPAVVNARPKRTIRLPTRFQ